MEQEVKSHSKGLGILILFYAFVMMQNILGWRQFGGSALLVSIMSGTLVYMTIGLIRRQRVSWFIAVAFHILYQLLMILSVVAMSNAKNMQELYKVLPAESVPLAKTMLVAAFGLLTIANVFAVIYLIKNKKNFSSVGNQN